MPKDKDELWTIVLQGGQYLEPIVREYSGAWADWLCRIKSESLPESAAATSAVIALLDVLKREFDAADAAVLRGLKLLRDNDFPRPDAAHVLRTAMCCGGDVSANFLLAMEKYKYYKIMRIHLRY